MQKLTQRCKNIFTLDTTSLAIFRIFFGIVLLLWLSDRIYQLDRLLWAQAIVTPALSFHYFMWDTTWNFHLLHGTTIRYYGLFCIHYLLIFAFICWWKTKQTTFFLRLFTVSLRSSNIPVYNHFDTLLWITLFWSIFLPVGYSYSWDCYQKTWLWKRENLWVFSLATVGITIQIVLIYVCAAYLRWDATWVKDMTGIWYVLHNTILAFPLWILLGQYLWFTKILSLGYMILEWRGWLFFMIPWRQSFFRKCIIICFILFHFGILVTMDIEVISLEMIALWLAFRPREREWYISVTRDFVTSFLQVWVIIFVFAWNLMILKPQYAYIMPANYQRYWRILWITQSWGAFLGKHSTFSWYALEGKTTTWSVSVLPVSENFSLENKGTHHYKGEKERKFFENIAFYTWLPEPILAYYCRKSPSEVQTLVLHKIRQTIEIWSWYGPIQSLEIARKECH